MFAPTDAAFQDLPEGALEELMADKAKLVALLKYHVVPGRVPTTLRVVRGAILLFQH